MATSGFCLDARAGGDPAFTAAAVSVIVAAIGHDCTNSVTAYVGCKASACVLFSALLSILSLSMSPPIET